MSPDEGGTGLNLDLGHLTPSPHSPRGSEQDPRGYQLRLMVTLLGETGEWHRGQGLTGRGTLAGT